VQWFQREKSKNFVSIFGSERNMSYVMWRQPYWNLDLQYL